MYRPEPAVSAQDLLREVLDCGSGEVAGVLRALSHLV